MKLLLLPFVLVLKLVALCILMLSIFFGYVFWFPDSWIEYKRYKLFLQKNEQYTNIGFLLFSVVLTFQLNMIYFYFQRVNFAEYLESEGNDIDENLGVAMNFIWMEFLRLKGDE